MFPLKNVLLMVWTAILLVKLSTNNVAAHWPRLKPTRNPVSAYEGSCASAYATSHCGPTTVSDTRAVRLALFTTGCSYTSDAPAVYFGMLSRGCPEAPAKDAGSLRVAFVY